MTRKTGRGSGIRSSIDFRVLGSVEVEAGGRDLTPPRTRERAVLALLVLRHPGSVRVDELTETLWGEAPPPTARTVLQGLVSALRRTIGPERIETTPDGYRLRLLEGDRRDIDRFDALVADAAGAPPATRAELLREAVALFRDAPLEDVGAVLDLPADVGADVAALEARRLAAEEARLTAELDLGRHVEAIPHLERLVAREPVREALRAQLMLALYRAGRQADALRVAQDARTVLATELGVEPGPALQALERRILEQDEGLLIATPNRPTGSIPSDGLVTLVAALGDAPEACDELVRIAASQGGTEVSSRRGGVVAFARARDAAGAAAAAQRAAARSSLPLRLGLHSGRASIAAEVELAVGLALAAHPGQVVVSRATRDLLREAPAGELDVRELGEHRLSDLAPRRPLYQLVAPGMRADFPPTRGLDDLPTNLPVQSTALVDRADEIDQVAALLRDDRTRLVTLTGPGGTGKTRLALHVAAGLLPDSPDGAWFVGLETLVDPELVASSIASELGLTSEAPDPLQDLIGGLRDRSLLIVLDNFEHLPAGAAHVDELLDGAPGVKVLVTSRRPLKLAREQVVEVPPLPVPGEAAGASPGEAAALAVPSVALFADRAAAVRPGFVVGPADVATVGALCRALEGLPLAIELAAGRVGVMSPSAILERLDEPLRLLTSRTRGGSRRQHAVEATIAWSHDLLDSGLQQLFAGLATFSGGWTLEAAEAVCGDGLDVVDGLAALVDHSLVRIGGSDSDPRFSMLEMIRAYAVGRLDASGRRPEAERRHEAFFVRLAETAEPFLRGNPGPWLVRLEAEHDNLRAALDRLARSPDPGHAHGGTGDAALDGAATEARLAGSLWRFWYLAGHLREGRVRLEHAASGYPDATPTRLKVLLGAAVMAMNLGDPAHARERAAEALRLAGSLDDAWSAAYAQFMLANAAGGLDDAASARRAFEDSLRAFRELGDEHSALLASRGLAGTLDELGDRDAARALHQDNLRRARAAGNPRLEASTLGALATIAFDEGRVVDATLLLRESLRLHRELGDRLDTAVDVARTARALALGERPGEAAKLLGSVSAIRAELGPRGQRIAAIADETRARLLRRMPASEAERLAAEGAGFRLETAVEMALDALG